MKNMSIQSRLAFTMLFLGLLIMAVCSAGIWGMYSSNNYQKETSTNQLPSLERLMRSQIDLSSARLGLDRLVSHPEQTNYEANLAHSEELLTSGTKAFNDYLALPADSDEKALADLAAKDRETFYTKGITPFVEAIRTHDTAKANDIMMHDLSNYSNAFNSSNEKLINYQRHSALSNYQKSVTSYNNMFMMMSALFVVGIGCAFVAWFVLRQAIIQPLNQAMEHFLAISQGDLTTHIKISKMDEMGKLLQALKTMQANLTQTMQGIKNSSDQIASASHQIAAGNLDLSQRTEEQAASLEETAASMEQMTATVKHNADNTKQAVGIANKASKMASAGEEVVSHVVKTMQDIDTSSRKIGELLSVIEGIAFQTNILALNAAVEAARAGEHGRGFAVVASEVRNLASRVAVSSKEIKVLITESNEKVGNGTELVAKAGETMTHIVQAVKSFTDIMEEISAASVEQSIGINQVNQAVSQMDEVTQQNAALVEEASAAASSLDDQAKMLNESVAVFKLS